MAPSWYPQKPPSWRTRAADRGWTVADQTTPPPPFGPLIQTLERGELDDEARTLEHLAAITDLRTVASYSWVDRPDSGPEILIPGRSPLWTPQATQIQLQEDSGHYYRDKNAARYPEHPMEPAVVASLDADPALPRELDVFACKSTVGSLLSFVRGEGKEFRMLAYKAGRTVFLVRRENSPTELIQHMYGYGHAFLDANRTLEADVKGSASHQRIVRYVFGGLRVAVRFEADAYMKPGTGGGDGEVEGDSDSDGDGGDSDSDSDSAARPALLRRPSSSTTATTPAAIDNLATALSAAYTTKTTTTTATGRGRDGQPDNNSNNDNSDNSKKTHSKLVVRRAGDPALVPHSALVDIKTRRAPSGAQQLGEAADALVAQELPRLWAAQVPALAVAFHARGLFRPRDAVVRPLRPGPFRRFERDHRPDLARLAALLRRLPGLVAAAGDGVVEICRRQRRKSSDKSNGGWQQQRFGAGGRGGGRGGGHWRGRRDIIKEQEGKEERKEEEKGEGEDELEIRKPGGEITAVLSDEVLQQWVSAAGDGGDDESGSEMVTFKGGASTRRHPDSAVGAAGTRERVPRDSHSDQDDDDDDDDHSGADISEFAVWESEDLDYTACSAEKCGYCGRCSY
ncbi:hypothetical protein VTH06DRAFT_910 [Thermothelomyces fergusii]